MVVFSMLLDFVLQRTNATVEDGLGYTVEFMSIGSSGLLVFIFFFNGTGFCCEFEVIELLSVLVARDFNNLKGLMGRL